MDSLKTNKQLLEFWLLINSKFSIVNYKQIDYHEGICNFIWNNKSNLYLSAYIENIIFDAIYKYKRWLFITKPITDYEYLRPWARKMLIKNQIKKYTKLVNEK